MEVFNSLIEQDQSNHFKGAIPIFSSVLENHNLFAKQTRATLKPLVSKINNSLNGFKTRANGLRLLQLLLPQCPQEVLVENGEKWVRFCIQIITSVTGPDMKIAACQVITRILQEARNIPNLQNALATKQILAITTSLAAAKSEICNAAFECLFEFLQLFPGQCTNQKNAIEKEILKHIDTVSPCSGNNCFSGKVFSALPLPGAGGKVEGIAKGRGQQLSALIALTHTTLDFVLEGMVEVQRYEYTKDFILEIDALRLDPKCPDMTKVLLAGICRVANTLSFIREMISGKHNEAISLVPSQLLGTVLRILQMQTPMLSQYRSQEHQFVAFMFPILHQKALLLLEDILHSIGECIDLYWGILMKILITTLDTCTLTKGIKTSHQTNSSERPQKGLKTKVLAYRVLCVLLQISKGRHGTSDGLLHHLKRDILPIKDPIKLQVKGAGLATINLQKKKSKKKGYAVTVNEDTRSVNSKGVSEEDLGMCQAALSATHHLFLYSLHVLHYKQVVELQSAVLSLSSYIIQGEAAPAPYNRATVRTALCQLLCALVCNPQPYCPPPFTAVSYVLHVGVKDHSPEVQKVCHDGLSKMSFIMANPQVSVYENLVQKHKETKDINGTEEESDVENLESSDENTFDLGKGEPEHALEKMEDELHGQDSCKLDERHTEEQELRKEQEKEQSEEEENASSEEDGDRKEEESLYHITTKDATLKIQESGEGEVESVLTLEQCEDGGKRKCKNEEGNQSGKKVKHSGISVDDMLASFVDADPDPDSD
ncbi:proline-, glutamic acid- and leucine-rich protein 1-like isoform X2 [Oratosquilla oratoria]|uniref:proline-, glutamic acid- and leucine-rich protein 1-like isoform X2 n=1 Tax=Oratosquilla oratoria TaxID=337810 RepID=UPI003F76B9F7